MRNLIRFCHVKTVSSRCQAPVRPAPTRSDFVAPSLSDSRSSAGSYEASLLKAYTKTVDEAKFK